MAGFDRGLRTFATKVERLSRELVPAVAAAAHESITVGSALTGAPGQPVGQYGPGYHEGDVGGELRSSWQVRFPSLGVAEVVTNNPYAVPNEDGVTEDGRPYVQRSTVGGRHSVKLTVAGMQKIVDHEAARLVTP